MDLLKVAQDALAQEPKEFPNFKAGDTVTVTYVIKEENKERQQYSYESESAHHKASITLTNSLLGAAPT